MLALAALVCATLFAGAALYISFAEHPARMKLDDRAALAQWQPSYDRAAILQASLAILGGALAAAAWYRWQSNWFWLAGGIVLLLNVPYTCSSSGVPMASSRRPSPTRPAPRPGRCWSNGATSTSSALRLASLPPR